MLKRKSHQLLFSLFAVTSLAIGCNQSDDKSEETKPVATEINPELTKGFQLLESNCFSCHNPNINSENKIAPTLGAIKKYYAENNETQAQFTQALISFLDNPTEESSIIPNAISQYGVMPKMGFSEAQIKEISLYLYQTDIANPNWFAQSFEIEKKHLDVIIEEEISYQDIGLKHALATKSVLGKNLMGAIKKQGTEKALMFCNVKAYPLTDSMSTELNTSIKRVSDKARNPKNKANENQLEYIYNSKDVLAKGEKIKPLVQELDGKMVGYYPIVTNKMCMQCHGEPEAQIKSKTLKKIKELYPDDSATGYKENELRGIWVVNMDKK